MLAHLLIVCCFITSVLSLPHWFQGKLLDSRGHEIKTETFDHPHVQSSISVNEEYYIYVTQPLGDNSYL